MKLGLAWYRRDQWELLRSTAADVGSIEDTFDQWLDGAGKSLAQIRSKGMKAGKVDFDVAEFNEWCGRNGKPRNSASRAEYVVVLMTREAD